MGAESALVDEVVAGGGAESALMLVDEVVIGGGAALVLANELAGGG